MKDTGGSKKRELILKSNSRIILFMGIAGAVFGFSLVASISLIKQMSYRTKVINARVKAEKQLKANIAAVETLKSSYETFNNAPESVIGTSDKNSKVILDALPSKYDFPALIVSFDKIMKTSGIGSGVFSGSDSEATASQSSTSPTATEIPFTITGQGSYANVQQLLSYLQKSIRPIKITKLTLSGEQKSLNVSVTGVTYYQPKKELDIPLEEVK